MRVGIVSCYVKCLQEIYSLKRKNLVPSKNIHCSGAARTDFKPVLKTSLEELLPLEFRERVFKEFDNLWIGKWAHLYER